MHDSLGQHLTGAAITAHLLAKKLKGRPEVETATKLVDLLDQGVELTRSAVLFAAMALAEEVNVDAVSRAKYLVGTYGRLVGQEAIQLHGGIGMTAEYAVGHYTSRLATIERTFGDTRQHLAALAAGVGGHTSVDVV